LCCSVTHHVSPKFCTVGQQSSNNDQLPPPLLKVYHSLAPQAAWGYFGSFKVN
jgi:hypothetical protein